MGNNQNSTVICCGLIILIGILYIIFVPVFTGRNGLNASPVYPVIREYFPWVLWIIIAVVLIGIIYKVALWFIGIYNGFFRLKNASEATFSQIRVAMKKRLDLISQLREATESYTQFERGTFEGVTAMRSAVDSARPGDLDRIESASQSLLGRLFAVVENYPDLKASTLITDLMSSIRNVENEIAQHRYKYNTITQDFNTLLDTIPTNIVGKMIGLKKMEYIRFEEEISTVPKAVSLGK